MASNESSFTEKTINGRSAILRKDAQVSRKILESMCSEQVKAEKKAKDELLKINEQYYKAKADGDRELLAILEKDRSAANAKLAELHKKTEDAIAEVSIARAEEVSKKLDEIEKSKYSKMSVRARQAYQAQVAEELDIQRKKYQEEYDLAKKLYGATSDEAKAAKNKITTADKQYTKASAESERLLMLTGSSKDKAAYTKAKAEKAHEKVTDAKANLKEVIASDKGVLEAQKRLDEMRKKGNKEEIAYAKKELQEKKKAAKESDAYLKAERALKAANHEADLADELAKREATKASFEAAGEALKGNLKKGLENIGGNALSALTGGIDGNIEAMFGKQGKINTRLQGNNEYGIFGEFAYNELVKDIQTNVGMSGVVSQKEVVAKMVELADSGVVYNLEMRAFLAATADNIASTFDAFDSNLLRLIRIQQADTTAARMGMEQSLTELFNKYFNDSSYMNKGGAADTVSASIIDAMSQMTKDNALSFEYTLQKWLGALYSLGLSEEAVSTIAEGINYLGTGNVSALNSNDTLQTLLAMSASRAGKSYADLLTTGLTADDTNDLLKAMIEYLAEISQSQKNMVTKAAYSDLFGMTITDLSTFQQLQSKEVEKLYESNLDYNEMMTKTQTQLATMVTRLNLGNLIDTAMDNAMTGAAVDIGNNPALYGTWKVLNMIESLTGGIAIPAVEIYGFMVDLHTTVEGLAKAGVAGLGLMGSLLSSLFSGSLLGTFSLNQWGYEEFTSRGAAKTQLFEGTSSDLSQSAEMSMVGSSSSDDLKSTSMNDATQDAQDDSGTSSEEMQEGKELNEKIYDAIAASETDTVLSQLHRVVELLDEKRVFYTQSASGGFTSSSRVTSILSAYNGMESSSILNNTVATTERASLLHEIARSTAQTASSSAAASEGDVTLSDVIVQAVSAALIASANELTFKAEIDNSFSNPIAVKSVV